MTSFRDRLYISTTAEDAPALARAYGVGLEIAEYCTASHMDAEFSRTDAVVRAAMEGVERFTFHAPFNELFPAAIDPRARDLALDRYRQAIRLSSGYGIRKIVVHGGFVPLIYHPVWFKARSVPFWREVLDSVPADTVLCLENVMEPEPDMLLEIVEQVDDPRFRLCLDVGHAAVQVSRIPPRDWIAPYAPWLAHVHLHNNDGRTDLHQPLGDGVLDMPAILEELDRRCPNATCTIENILAAPSMEWLKINGYI